jgi:hypothetical protein
MTIPNIIHSITIKDTSIGGYSLILTAEDGAITLFPDNIEQAEREEYIKAARLALSQCFTTLLGGEVEIVMDYEKQG